MRSIFFFFISWSIKIKRYKNCRKLAKAKLFFLIFITRTHHSICRWPDRPWTDQRSQQKHNLPVWQELWYTKGCVLEKVVSGLLHCNPLANCPRKALTSCPARPLTRQWCLIYQFSRLITFSPLFVNDRNTTIARWNFYHSLTHERENKNPSFLRLFLFSKRKKKNSRTKLNSHHDLLCYHKMYFSRKKNPALLPTQNENCHDKLKLAAKVNDHVSTVFNLLYAFFTPLQNFLVNLSTKSTLLLRFQIQPLCLETFETKRKNTKTMSYLKKKNDQRLHRWKILKAMTVKKRAHNSFSIFLVDFFFDCHRCLFFLASPFFFFLWNLKDFLLGPGGEGALFWKSGKNRKFFADCWALSRTLSPFLPSALLAKARLTRLDVVRASSGRRAMRCKLVSSSSMCVFFLFFYLHSLVAARRIATHSERGRLKFASAQCPIGPIGTTWYPFLEWNTSTWLAYFRMPVLPLLLLLLLLYELLIAHASLLQNLTGVFY